MQFERFLTDSINMGPWDPPSTKQVASGHKDRENRRKKQIPCLSRWWFQICFIFTPNFGEDSHFDSYFSNRLVETTN